MRPATGDIGRAKPNHNAPSGPAAMLVNTKDCAEEEPVMGNSVTAPAVVIRPILLLFRPRAANHNAPSGPATMLSAGMEMGNNSVIVHRVLVKPTLSAC
jgi:hypothetical protein